MLCARYKLDNDTNNSGDLITNDTWEESPTFVSGNIYKNAMALGSMSWDADSTARILNNNAFTWAGWIYINSSEGLPSNSIIFGNNSFSEKDNRKFTILQYPTCNDVSWSWMNDLGGVTFASGRVEGILSSYGWNHLAVTYGDSTVKLYIDGVLCGTQFNVKSDSSSFAYKTQVFHSTNNRYLQDVRIYNECLTEQNIKDLAIGLSQHEKFCDDNHLAKDLISSKFLINCSSSFTVNTPDHYFIIGKYSNSLVIGKKYVYEVVCDSPNNVLADNHGSSLGNPSYRTWTCWLYMANINYSNSNYQNYDNPTLFTSKTPNHYQVGNKHFWVFTARYAHASIRLNGYAKDNSTRYSLNFPEIKLYELSISQNVDTARYSNSIRIPLSNRVSFGFVIGRTNCLSISFWVKFINLSSNFKFFSCNNADAYTNIHMIKYRVDDNGSTNIANEKTYIEKSTDGITYKNGVQLLNNGSEIINNDCTGYAETGINLSYNNGTIEVDVDNSKFKTENVIFNTDWHQIVLTSDNNRYLKLYIDKDLILKGDCMTSSDISRAISTELPTFYGDISVSDFRIYGKTISSEDVSNMYGVS